MTERTALFIPDGDVFLPGNQNAVAACAILSSSRRISRERLIEVRGLGYTPRLLSGEEIGKVDYKV